MRNKLVETGLAGMLAVSIALCGCGNDSSSSNELTAGTQTTEITEATVLETYPIFGHLRMVQKYM